MNHAQQRYFYITAWVEPPSCACSYVVTRPRGGCRASQPRHRRRRRSAVAARAGVSGLRADHAQGPLALLQQIVVPMRRSSGKNCRRRDLGWLADHVLPDFQAVNALGHSSVLEVLKSYKSSLQGARIRRVADRRLRPEHALETGRSIRHVEARAGARGRLQHRPCSSQAGCAAERHHLR